MKRGCTYDDVTNILVFPAADQAGCMTGQAINVTGRRRRADQPCPRAKDPGADGLRPGL